MPVRIVTADERLAQANNKTSLAIFGPPGCGKTSLLKALPADRTICLDLEAGMKSIQDWPGASIPIRSFLDFRDLAVLIGGPIRRPIRTPGTAPSTISMPATSMPAADLRSSCSPAHRSSSSTASPILRAR